MVEISLTKYGSFLWLLERMYMLMLNKNLHLY